MVKVLKTLCPLAQEKGIMLVTEPLNTLVDHRGNFLSSMAEAVKVVEMAGCPNVKVLYDIYHMQIMEGNIINTINKYFDRIGYMHVADVPGRHEPGTGEINYVNVFNTLRALNYDGIVGFELFPINGCTETSNILNSL